MKFSIRPGERVDVPLMWQMLSEAAAANPEIGDMDREAVLSLPMVRKYAENWGREGDRCVVATAEQGRQLGAAWYRLFPETDPGYGFVRSDVPELTIGVIAEARRSGIGGALLQAILEAAKEDGYSSLSLSVGKDSNAVRLYHRYGFKVAAMSPGKDLVTMVKDLENANA